jgi:hypothetical protein
MIGHLGPKISALLDGQLSSADEERAWEHVHGCHQCRDQVEREGWVKTQLVGLSFGQARASADLKGSLLVSGWGGSSAGAAPDELFELAGRSRRHGSLTALGGGAVGAAVMGVLALGAASPANAPTSISPGSGWGSSLRSVNELVDRTYGPQPASLSTTRKRTTDGPRAVSSAPGSGHASQTSGAVGTDLLTRAVRRTLSP